MFRCSLSLTDVMSVSALANGIGTGCSILMIVVLVLYSVYEMYNVIGVFF